MFDIHIVLDKNKRGGIMKIIIAPDSFKGSNTSIAVANIIEIGIG